MATEETIIYVLVPNERPDYRLVSTFLWSEEMNINTDGDSYNPASRVWTQLYIANRQNSEEEVDIYPAQAEPLILRVCSRLEYLAVRAAYFLAHYTKGEVSALIDKDFADPTTLKSKVGAEFSIEDALRRTENSRYANTTLDNPYPWLKDS